MSPELWKLHDRYMELYRRYTDEATYYAQQEQYAEGQYWAGKAYAIQYAASLLSEELNKDA